MSNIKSFRPGVKVILHVIGREGGGGPEWYVLLMRRDHAVKAYPGFWSLPGGVTEEGETIVGAAEREVQEELGVALRLNEAKHLTIVDVAQGSAASNAVYVSQALSWEAWRHCQCLEGIGIGLFTEESAASLPLVPQDRIALEEFWSGILLANRKGVR